MKDLNNTATNQILNNFKTISKLYLELKEISISNINFFTAASSNGLRVNTSAEKISFPYYINDAETVLSTVFNLKKIDKTSISINGIEYQMDLKTVSILIGYLRSRNKPHMTVNKAVSENDFHIANYLILTEEASFYTISYIYMMLGLLNDAEMILSHPNDGKDMILLSKINRKKGDINRAVSILGNVKSKENEIERNIEYAWLHLKIKNYENAYKIFNYYKDNIDEENLQEVLFGYAISILRLDDKKLPEAIEFLLKASKMNGHYKIDILNQLALIYTEIKDYIKAHDIYSEIYSLSPSSYILSRVAMCELAISKNDEASKKLFDCAVFDTESVEEIIKNFNPASINNNYPLTIVTRKEEDEESSKIIEAILAPEDISKRTYKPQNKKEEKTEKINFTTSYEASEQPQEPEKDSLTSEAFSFSKQLEEEFGKKVYFNYEGLDDIERKIRVTFMTETSEEEQKATVKAASSFLFFMIKERFKSTIIRYEDLDSWAWSAIIKNKKGLEIMTYTAARLWKVLWSKKLPDQGWIKRYVNYIGDFINATEEPPAGKEAIDKKAKSHSEKIFDAQIEHRKIIIVARDIEETSTIPISSSGLMKLEQEIKKRYKPEIPPTVDGWKVLRCYAHIFLEMILKDFDVEWYNVEKNDGLWSFNIGNSTYIFPVGKIYKVASLRENLADYYDILIKNARKKYTNN
jgi:tetratricopeptide (TPR) repeat protein